MQFVTPENPMPAVKHVQTSTLEIAYEESG